MAALAACAFAVKATAVSSTLEQDFDTTSSMPHATSSARIAARTCRATSGKTVVLQCRVQPSQAKLLYNAGLATIDVTPFPTFGNCWWHL